MKIYIANNSSQSLGGGWTFIRNIISELSKREDVEFVDYGEEDIFFIPSSSMLTDRDMLNDAKRRGSKVVLRLDNIPRNSRNRNTGTTRLYDYAQQADLIIFQSRWAKGKTMPLIASNRIDISNEYNGFIYGRDNTVKGTLHNTVIINGVNLAKFSPSGPRYEKNGISRRFLIMRYNRDENKRIEEAFDLFTQEWIKDKTIEAFIVGPFSNEQLTAHFDFYLGERYRYFGIVDSPDEIAKIMRSCDVMFYPSYSDACPNQVLEARATGLTIVHNGHAALPEVLDESLDISLERMGNEYYDAFKSLL